MTEDRLTGGFRFDPLAVQRDGQRVCLSFVESEAILAELPPELDTYLEQRLGELLETSARPDVVFDLHNAPGISSRQLGVLLALHKTLRPRVSRLPLTGVSENVRRLLEMTRTAQFFELV